MKREIKKKLAKLLLQRIKDWGFTIHKRDCHQCSDYGTIDKETGQFLPDDEIVMEEWSNEDFIDVLLDVNNKEISQDVEKINNLLTPSHEDKKKV
jgi:hypothetical protein